MDATFPPWLQPDFLPEKPDAHSYGYVLRGALTPCRREELLERCRRGHGAASLLVWAPESPRIVPAVELPFLQEAIRARRQESLRRNICVVGFGVLIYSLMRGLRDPQAVESQIFLLASFALLPLGEGWWQLRELRRHVPWTWPAYSISARFLVWARRQSREVSWFLSTVIVIVFVLQVAHGLPDSFARTGLTKGPFRAEESYRFLTGALMHASRQHAILNALALFILGSLVEVLLGASGLAFLFVASALGGSIASYFFTANTSIGASGGIAGLLGCLTVLGLYFRKILPPAFGRSMLYAVFLTALSGLTAPEIIDNAAHAGGLVVGAVLGWGMIRARTTTTLPLVAPDWLVWAGRFALLLVLVALVVLTKFLWPG